MDKAKVAKDLLKSAHRFWLMKTEPGECSIDDVLNAPQQAMEWFGIRNYQARNFMRDDMQVGDAVLFYHSSCPNPGIVGLATIHSKPYPDATQFDPDSEYYDPKSTKENPRWVLVDVKALVKFPVVPLSAIRDHEELKDMLILRKGNRLSITPVTKEDFAFITEHLI